jgi:hypothetical protein
MQYRIRCDVESVDPAELTADFRSANCVYPRACVPKEEYKGNRYNYESECNQVGWALAHLNPTLREKRGLIQRAVDSWRNSNRNEKLQSRRVRRMKKNDERRNASKTPTSSSGPFPGPPAQLSLPMMPAPQGMQGGRGYSMGSGVSPMHPHPPSDGSEAGSGNDVTGMFHQM